MLDLKDCSVNDSMTLNDVEGHFLYFNLFKFNIIGKCCIRRCNKLTVELL